MKILKVILALLFGAFAGFFIYLDLGLILFRQTPGWFVFLAFFGGWGFSTHWVTKGTKSISEMLGKSFLLSALFSFGLTPACLVFASKAVSTTGSGAEVAGSVIGGGLVGGFGVTVSLVLTFFSMLGYGLLKLFTKESVGAGMIACGVCAEPIRATAKKCRHCGEFAGAE